MSPFETTITPAEIERPIEPKAKEKDIEKEKITKEAIFDIYENVQNIKNNKEVTPELDKLLPEGKEITATLKQIPVQTNLMEDFKGYLKAKKEAAESKSPEATEMHLFFEVENEPTKKLISQLEDLSQKFGKDIILDLAKRNKLESTITKMDKYINEHEFEKVMMEYGRINDEMLRDDNQRLLKKEKLLPEEETILKKIKQDIDWVADQELTAIKNKDLGYENLSQEKIEETKKKLLALKSSDYRQSLDIYNLGFTGLLMERRISEMDKYKKKFEVNISLECLE